MSDNLVSPSNNPETYNDQFATTADTKKIDVADESTVHKTHYIETVEDPTITESAQDYPDYELKPRKKFSWGRLISTFVIIVCLVVLGFGGFFAYSLMNTSNQSLALGQEQNLFDQTKQLLGTIINPSKRTELKGEKDGRTNVLLLGADAVAGLTDTMMIASYYYNEKKVVTVNIPRDTQVFDGFETSKMNATFNNAVIRSKEKDSAKRDVAGAEALSNVISKEFGITIHYWAKVNFDGVKSIVDELGGVNVNVKRDLVDCLYPNDDYKIVNGSVYIRPCPSFKTGKQKMDGRTALIFSRSRQTTSDFDRGERQSLVIQAILEKIKEQGVFENAAKINNYLNIVGQNFRTSLQISEIAAFAQILKESDISNNFLRIVWATGNGFLCSKNTPETGYVIQYCGGAVFGRTQASPAKTRAKNQIQNLLSEALKNRLFDAQVVLLGNQSGDITKAYNEFERVGFASLDINNTYKTIPVTKKGANTTTTIYILDSEIKALYDSLEKKPAVNFTIETKLPENKILPKDSQDAKIVIWSE